MKKFISLSMFLLLCPMDVASINKDAAQKKAAVRSCGLDCSSTLCCDRGPRGPRGKRGRRGPAGPDATAGLNEFFINEEMMYSGVDEASIPATLHPYGPENNLLAWVLPDPTGQEFTSPIFTTFPLPVDMDLSQPVTFVAHLFVGSSALITGNTADLLIELSVKSDGDLFGATPPAVGPQFSVESGDFTVIPATPPASTNLRQITVSMPIDLTGATPGQWVYFDILRIPATANEFSGILYLNTISVQYHRLVS